jgi:V/A-type H+-transporting ATPase subunit I
MLKPAEMKYVEALVLERDLRAVTERLGRLGLVHLEEATEADGGDLVHLSRLDAQFHRVQGLLERVELLCDTLGIPESTEPASVPYSGPDEVTRALAPIEAELEGILSRRKALDSEIETEYQVLRDIEAFKPIETPPDELQNLSFLHFAIGTVPGAGVHELQEATEGKAVLLPFKSPDGQQRIIALSSRAGRFALQSMLDEHGFQAEALPKLKGTAPAEVVGKTRDRLLTMAQDLDALREASQRTAQQVGGQLATYRERLRVDLQLLQAQAYFGRTDSTCLIAGYVPSVRIDALRQELLQLTDGRVVIEVAEPLADDPAIPTMMQNPRLLRPFELLVAGYGQPGYNEVEPTPLVAISFLLMFGVMFGDIGHGLVLALAGMVMFRKCTTDTLRDFGLLLTMAGGASMLAGLVFGSFFGAEIIHPPLGGWFRPMHKSNIDRLLIATVVLGVVVISLGVVLNIINRIRRRDYFHVVMDRFGIVGFIFYWGALGLGIRSVVTGHETSTVALLLLVVMPLAILFFREPIHYLLTRKNHTRKFSVFGGLIEGFVDILETLSAYIANTVSFMRVGAFALAHAAVCAAIFATVEIVSTMPGGPIWSAMVVVGGNVFVILLEGLVVSIQAMRLEYYEFFSKFFRGDGRAYRPFTLRKTGHD